MDEAGDKQWAKKYILDPLNAPEPSQETGPGSSFYNVRRSLSLRVKEPESPGPSHHRQHKSSGAYPSPPPSASPSRSSFHPSNPFSDHSRHQSPPPGQGDSSDWAPRHSSSSSRYSSGYELQEAYYHPQSSSSLGRSKTVYAGRRPPQTPRTRNLSGTDRSPGAAWDRDRSDSEGLRRSGSLNARHAGDMSNRPLDMLQKEQRRADRAPVRRRGKQLAVDPIDVLDNSAVGGVYHHDGPFDATMASRNVDKRYSPLEAVHDSNMEALRATPREYVQDSLDKHVPLRGIASVPPGMTDMSGKVMTYDEGPDLMREPDAAGGAYKRWDFLQYRDDDLKGKSEPSYTIEKGLKGHGEGARRHGGARPEEYEMLPTRDRDAKDGGVATRQRSVSAAGAGRPASPAAGASTTSDLRRSNTTGKRLSEGLKRRFGNIRRKMNSDDA